MSLKIRPLSYQLGAEISGVDIREPLDKEALREIHDAFLQHSVLLFRGQRLTQEQVIAFGSQFGELDDNADLPPAKLYPQHPEIIVHNPTPDGKPKLKYAGKVWHSDHVYRTRPAMATLLRAIETPPVGGDTMFSNMYMAYDALSDGMKKILEGLHGVHFGGKHRPDHLAPPVAQPLVRVHPETGRSTLYVGDKCKQIVGFNDEEAGALLRYLCGHAARPQFVYRHQWQTHDLLMWDNRCTNHLAVNDYDKTQRRHMEKAVIRGTPSGYVYEGPLHYSGPRL